MKTQVTIAVAALALSACTATEEQIAEQQVRCQTIGYEVGSDQYLACVERGVIQKEQANTAVAVGAGAAAVQAGILAAYW